MEGAAAAAARPVAAGKLRFRPRHVFSGYRRLRVCHWRDQDGGGPWQRRPVAALRGIHARAARCDRRANTNGAGWRQARHRDRVTDRPPRRDFAACQRCDVHLRPRTRAVDIRISHGRGRGVFFAVRALLALIPGLTVSFPIKKWSAAAALAAAAFYLLLSCAEVATQRSFFMTAVVLIAIMVDRRAVTFRTLAVAAMIVLAIAPEALVHPSFQMSFAATLGLVALVQIGMAL